jgi:hypothetical protein
LAEGGYAVHYPGHLRDAFLDWLDEGCPPLARVEVNHEPQTWTAEQLCRYMLRCSGIMPGEEYRWYVEQLGLERSRTQTYGSVARVLLDEIHAAADRA